MRTLLLFPPVWGAAHGLGDHILRTHRTVASHLPLGLDRGFYPCTAPRACVIVEIKTEKPVRCPREDTRVSLTSHNCDNTGQAVGLRPRLALPEVLLCEGKSSVKQRDGHWDAATVSFRRGAWLLSDCDSLAYAYSLKPLTSQRLLLRIFDVGVTRWECVTSQIDGLRETWSLPANSRGNRSIRKKVTQKGSNKWSGD